MHDITDLDGRGLPSNRQLLKATVIAIAVAALILVTCVLPAEYGFDPTGIGKRLGLVSLSAPRAPVPALKGLNPDLSLSNPVMPLNPVWRATAPPRSDQQSVTLAPNEGVEVKANMKTGDRFVFSWMVEGGTVSFDMHGEKHDARKDEFTSYWKGRDASSAHGEFEAPFTGRHGWYWQNRGAQPVTVTIKTSGFYETLYKI